MWPGLFSGQGAREKGREVPASEKARGKAPTVKLPPPEMDKEMAQHLQEEKKEAELVQREQDTAILAVVCCRKVLGCHLLPGCMEE